jgi:arylsulfatase A-like enzyme
MTPRLPGFLGLLALLLSGVPSATVPQTARRNFVIFIADGLRHGSVSEQETPALWAIRQRGVHFENSHAVYPTSTTPNASVIATGRGLGDTGNYDNTIWTGPAVFEAGSFNLLAASAVPFIEDDRILADLDAQFGGNYLGADTLLAVARRAGYRTATIGKTGPTAIQDIATIAPENHAFPRALPGILIDDATGTTGLPWPSNLSPGPVTPAAPTRSNGYGPTSPFNNGFTGDRSTPGTRMPNLVQQDWFDGVATDVVLPSLAGDAATPFILIYWSRDPDGTQHNQGDSLSALVPGINGETSRRGVRNADRSLQRLITWLDARPALKANTDVIVTSDHGFATISRSALDRLGRRTASESARHDYLTETSGVDTVKGTLPYGFLAIDLARDLQLNLFDADQRIAGSRLFRPIRIGSAATVSGPDTWEHPLFGNGLLAATGSLADSHDASLIVAANGGSDLIYVPRSDAELVKRVASGVLGYDYVDAVFVDDKYGSIDGTLPLSAVNLVGSSKMPRPAIVVAFRVFYFDPDNLLTAVQVSDGALQEGQGNHGGFGRESTYNNMAAIGPDFKARSVDRAPAGNGDIAPTVAHLIGADLPRGPLSGRVLSEALASGPAPIAATVRYLRSSPRNGRQTMLVYQEHDGVRYLDKACLVTPATPDGAACR